MQAPMLLAGAEDLERLDKYGCCLIKVPKGSPCAQLNVGEAISVRDADGKQRAMTMVIDKLITRSAKYESFLTAVVNVGIDAIIANLHVLPDSDRLEVFSHFCRECGGDNLRCQC